MSTVPVVPTTLSPVPATSLPIASTVVTTTPATTPAAPLLSDAYLEWSRVAVCEEGGWVGYAGPAYPDSLGIDSANWYGNGGASDVSPDTQIAVAERLEASFGTPGFVPDQDGCDGSW